jgi:ribosomal protein S10
MKPTQEQIDRVLADAARIEVMRPEMIASMGEGARDAAVCASVVAHFDKELHYYRAQANEAVEHLGNVIERMKDVIDIALESPSPAKLVAFLKGIKETIETIEPLKVRLAGPCLLPSAAERLTDRAFEAVCDLVKDRLEMLLLLRGVEVMNPSAGWKGHLAKMIDNIERRDKENPLVDRIPTLEAQIGLERLFRRSEVENERGCTRNVMAKLEDCERDRADALKLLNRWKRAQLGGSEPMLATDTEELVARLEARIVTRED